MSCDPYPTDISEAQIAPALAPENRLIWSIKPSSSKAYKNIKFKRIEVSKAPFKNINEYTKGIKIGFII